MTKTLSTRSLRLDSRYYLNIHKVTQEVSDRPSVRIPVNHIFCCDISGSMSESLPKMRTQLKNNVTSVVHGEDTLTIIAFASPHECFVLKEKAKVNSPTDLIQLNDAIDRFLVPMGWTDFIKPLEAANRIINDNGAYNLIFMSDGYHNDSSFAGVITATQNISHKLCAATVIEYGHYADSNALSRMAMDLNGSKVMADDFDTYNVLFENALRNAEARNRTAVNVESIFQCGMRIPGFFYIDETMHSVASTNLDADGNIFLPQDCTEFYSITTKVAGKKSAYTAEDARAALAMAYIAADNLEYFVVEAILNLTKFKNYLLEYSTAFGKNRLFKFENNVLKGIFDPSIRGEVDENYTPPDYSYCVSDLVNDLVNGDNYVLIDDDTFASYKRVSRKTEDSVCKLDPTKDVKELANIKDKKRLKEALDNVSEKLKEFSSKYVEMKIQPNYYPLTKLTWNETRANLSAMFNILVTLTLPKNDFGIEKIDSSIYRNFTLIKDGVVNMPSLRMLVDNATYDKFKSFNLNMQETSTEEGHHAIILDVASIPVLNRKRFHATKRAKMTKLMMKLMYDKFLLKYLGYLRKFIAEAEGNTVKTTPEWYDQKTAEYLASLGITPDGYKPAKSTVESTDFYKAPTFKSGFKLFSKIPAIEAILKKIADPSKYTASEKFLYNIMDEYNKKLGVESIPTTFTEEQKAMIIADFDSVTKEKREVSEEISSMKFSMLVARKWFLDSEDYEDNLDGIVNKFGDPMTLEYTFAEETVYV